MKNGMYYKNDRNIWYKDNIVHRDDDLPAVVFKDGDKIWYKNGLIHRDNDLPAIVSKAGEQWFRNDLKHREKGPAVITNYGKEYWFINGKDITDQVTNKNNWREWSRSDFIKFKLKFL